MLDEVAGRRWPASRVVEHDFTESGALHQEILLLPRCGMRIALLPLHLPRESGTATREGKRSSITRILVEVRAAVDLTPQIAPLAESSSILASFLLHLSSKQHHRKNDNGLQQSSSYEQRALRDANRYAINTQSRHRITCEQRCSKSQNRSDWWWLCRYRTGPSATTKGQLCSRRHRHC